MDLPILSRFIIPQIAKRWSHSRIMNDFESDNDRYQYIIQLQELKPYFQLNDEICLIFKWNQDKVFVGLPFKITHAHAIYYLRWYKIAGTEHHGIPLQYRYYEKSNQEKSEEKKLTVSNKIIFSEYKLTIDQSCGGLKIQIDKCLLENTDFFLRKFIPQDSQFNNSPFPKILPRNIPKFYANQIFVSSDELLNFEHKKNISIPTKNTKWSECLNEFNNIIFDFGQSDLYQKYGTETQKQLIDDWIKNKYPNKNRDESRVLNKLISAHYGI